MLQELHSLAYPVAQLLMGALRLMPTPSFFPLRLRLARALVGLERDTGLLIPLGPPLLDMLSWKGVSHPVLLCIAGDCIHLSLSGALVSATLARFCSQPRDVHIIACISVPHNLWISMLDPAH